MIAVELFVVLLFIFLGARIGGIGIGFAVVLVLLPFHLFLVFQQASLSSRSM